MVIGVSSDLKAVFLKYIDNTMVCNLNLNSKLDINLSCAKDFRNLNSMVTLCIN